MKTIILTIATALITITTMAQSPAYQKAMGKALTEMGKANSAEDLQKVANTFDRIATQADGDYLPKYYAALNLIHQSFYTKGTAEIDAIIEGAMSRIKDAEKLSPGNDELEVLNGYALMAKMVADPQTRGGQYSPMIMQSFGKAMSMDPTNPRAATMMARMQLGQAQFFGSEPTQACALAQKSIPLYDQEKQDGFNPTWGRDQAEDILQNCGE